MTLEELKEKIYEAINQHDMSYGCCGPTEISRSTAAVMVEVEKFLTEFQSKDGVEK